LTQFCSKPAVPIAGKYRLIDVPLSNSNVILDKNVSIGFDSRVTGGGAPGQNIETDQAMFVDGILVVKRGAVLKEGWQFQPSSN